METAFYAGTDIRKIIESLPKEEAEHMRRVGKLVGILTQKLYGYDTCNEYKYFGVAASYHDIGKAWVPKSILMKPDRLQNKKELSFANIRCLPRNCLIRQEKDQF